MAKRICSACGSEMEGSANPKCPATGLAHKFDRAGHERAEAAERKKKKRSGRSKEEKMGSQPGPYGPLVYSSDQWPGNVTYDNADAPINDATVENNPTAPQIETDAAPYIQPDTSAPSDNPAVDASSSLAEAPPNQIEPTGENYQQPNTSAPAANPEIGVPAKNLNPMGL